MIDCLFKSLAPATAKKAKKQNMLKLHQWCGAPAVLDQDWLVRLAATACQRSALPQRLPGRLPVCLCLLAWAAGAEIVSYLPALASTLSFSLAHHCPRLGAIKNRVTYQKMKKKFFYACYYTET